MTYNDLSIAQAGVGYTLSLSTGSMAPVVTHAFSISAQAGAATWTGAVDTDWNNAENWDGGFVPAGGVAALIPLNAVNAPVLSGTANLGSMTLNTNVDVGSATVTLDQAPTGTGVIVGESPTLIIAGTAGSAANPLNINVAGTLTLQASGMQDNVSVNIQGSGQVTLQGAVAGFVFINGALQDHLGQSEIRGMLNQNMSALFRGVENSNQSPGHPGEVVLGEQDRWSRYALINIEPSASPLIRGINLLPIALMTGH